MNLLALGQTAHAPLLAAGGLNSLAPWLEASSRISTLQDFSDAREVSRSLAHNIAKSPNASRYGDTIEQLQSRDYKAVVTGLLQVHASLAIDSKLRAHLEPHLDEDMQNEMDRQTQILNRTVGAPRPEFKPVTEAAAQANSALGYAFRRLVRNRHQQSQVAFDHYKYDIERVKGHFFVEEKQPLPPTLEQAPNAYAQKRTDEIEDIKSFVTEQIALSSQLTRNIYEQVRDRVLQEQVAAQQDYNDIVGLLRDGPTMPSFDVVSQAFWQRDEAILADSILRDNGIRPREFDLIKEHQAYERKKEAGALNDRSRHRYYMGIWSYLLSRVEADYAAAVENKEQTTARQLKKWRFTLEPILTKQALGKKVSRKEKQLLDEVSKHYLAFLSFDLQQSELNAVRELDQSAHSRYANYGDALRRVHAHIGKPLLQRFNRDQARIDVIDQQEQLWQVARYTNLMEQAAHHSPLTASQRKRFEQVLGDYEYASRDYLDYAQRMLQDDPETREYTRNKKHRTEFVRLWDLHRAVKQILIECGHPQADQLQLLTFAFKTQAQLLRREARGMQGMEPIAEITASMKQPLDELEKDAYSIKTLNLLGGRNWAANQLTHYFRNVVLVGAAQLFGYFGQAIRPETKLIEGALALYPSEALARQPEEFSHRGGIINALHTGQTEFAQAMGSNYLLGLPHTAILAQAGVSVFPVAGPFLAGLNRGGRLHKWLRRIPLLGKWLAIPFTPPVHHKGAGAYVQRAGSAEERRFASSILESHIHMGNLMNIYGNGTRDIDNPIFVNPYIDLQAHPEALHLPGYHPTRYSTGMPVALSKSTGRPIIAVGHDLSRVYAEPSMPMPAGFSIKEFLKSPRRALKPYAGFWNPGASMFPYMRPGQDSVTVAYSHPIPTESFLTADDLAGMSYAQHMAEWDQLPAKQRERKQRWLLRRLNFGLVRFAEEMSTYPAMAGLYGNKENT